MSPDLATARRTSPLSALFWVFRGEQLRTLLPVIIVGASSGRLVLVVLGVITIGAAYGIASWWRRTWSFTDGVLHLDDGVLVRNQRRIPVERIQHVELERRLRHQLFGLAGVRVETAGGSGAELHLDAVTRTEAEAIRSTVLTLLRDAPPAEGAEDGGLPPPPPPPPEVLVRLPPSRLLLAGVTGPEVLAVLAAITVGLDFVTDLGVDPRDVDAADASAAAVAVLAVLVLPLWFAVAALIGLVRRWDLTVTIVGDELRVTYGLLRRNEFVVKTARVQDVRIAHRLLLRPFGRADVRVRTAASGAGDQSRVDIPLLSDAEIVTVLARVLPAAVPLPVLAPAPPGARRRSLFRSTMLAAVVAVVVAGLLTLRSSVPALAVAAALLVPLGAAWGEAAYRGLGHARSQGIVHSRSGALTRHRFLVPEARIQSGASVASWFQRRRHLAHVRLDLAAGVVTVVDRDATEASRILATSTRATAPTGGQGRDLSPVSREL